MENSQMPITIGDLIYQYRKKTNLLLTEVAERAGIDKGVLSRIENNETKRPEIKTIKAIGTVLAISYAEMLKYYVQVENRTDILKQLLSEAIELTELELMRKIALRLIEAPHQNTYEALESLYQIAATDIPTTCKLVLYQVIARYAKEHGIHYWLAKSLLQKYLIERNDFSKLKETYESGREVLYITNYLSAQEKPIAYWKLGLHAYNLKLYEECIDLCKQALELAPENPDLMRSVLLAIIPSSIEVGDYDATESYLQMMEQLGTATDVTVIRITRAMTQTKRGNYDPALPVLEEYFHEYLWHRNPQCLNIATELLHAYLHQQNEDAMERIFLREEEILLLEYKTPYSLGEMGKFYTLKGVYHMNRDEFEQGIACYIKSITYYQKISNFEGIHECTKQIHLYHYKFQRVIGLELIEQLNRVL